MNRISIVNGRIITPGRIVNGGNVYIENGRIVEISSNNTAFPDAVVIDAAGQYISPGFIDLHTHGAGGCDFMDGTVDAYLHIAQTHAKHGATAICPTTLAATTDEMYRAFRIYHEATAKNTVGATFIGMHLEGPYFAMSQRGAQDPKYIRPPHPDEYMALLEATPNIARWSAAPELPGSRQFAAALIARGILPAIAHSDATYEELLPAFDWGFTHVTHLYSATSTVTRRQGFRHAGVIETAYLMDGMTVEIIADGVHLPESLLQLIYKIKGASHIALITDSMRAAGMPDGPSILGSLDNGQHVIVEDGVAKMPDRTAFAGSVATPDRLVRTMLRLAHTPMHDVIQMITSTPARILGIDRIKGSIAPGRDADIVIFDDDVNVKMTMIGGNVVYNANN